MVQPIDYATLAGGFQSPQEAFTNTIKLREYYLQQQKAAEDARLAKEKTVQMEADLKDYTTNPDPQKLASLHLRYPVLKESLNSYTQTLSDADKRTTTDFATQAFGLNRAGKTEDVLALFDRYIIGAEKRPEMVRAFKDAKEAYSKIEDPRAREALIGSVLAGTGKDGLDLYDKIWNAQDGSKLDTPFLKELKAEGLEPGTPEFKAALQAKREGDPYIAVAGVGLFLKDDVTRAASQGRTEVTPLIPQAAITMLKNDPKLAADFDRKYKTPDNPNPSARILGGQTGAPSGNFR
jgi:hypothetical protein